MHGIIAFQLLIDKSGNTDGKTSSKYNLMSFNLIMDRFKIKKPARILMDVVWDIKSVN